MITEMENVFHVRKAALNVTKIISVKHVNPNFINFSL